MSGRGQSVYQTALAMLAQWSIDALHHWINELDSEESIRKIDDVPQTSSSHVAGGCENRHSGQSRVRDMNVKETLGTRVLEIALYARYLIVKRVK